MYFDYIPPLSPAPPRSTPTNLSAHLLCYSCKSPTSPVCAAQILLDVGPSPGHPTRHHTLKENWLTLSPKLSIACSSFPHGWTSCHAGLLYSSSSGRSYACCQQGVSSYVRLPYGCLENMAPLESTTASGFDDLSVPSSGVIPECWRRECALDVLIKAEPSAVSYCPYCRPVVGP